MLVSTINKGSLNVCSNSNGYRSKSGAYGEELTFQICQPSHIAYSSKNNRPTKKTYELDYLRQGYKQLFIS